MINENVDINKEHYYPNDNINDRNHSNDDDNNNN